MLIFSVDEKETKGFMNKLFKESVFDNLEIRNIELETIVKYEILGNINKNYLKDGEERFFATWRELKPYIFQLIKGTEKPKSLKIVFSLSLTALESLHANAASAFLNISYENDRITATTGSSQKNFSLNKEVDIAWEDMIKRFFHKNAIDIEL